MATGAILAKGELVEKDRLEICIMAEHQQKSKKCNIALGTMTFGGQTKAREAERMLDMFLATGHSWVDTAFMYTEGRSERIVGRLLKGARRKRVFLATKAYPDHLGTGQPRGLTPGSVRGQLEISLRRMKLAHVDLFYLHAPDNRTPLEVSLGACRELVAEGKVREIGLSNYASWQVAEAVAICERNGWKKPLIYQGMYNAITRDIERECIVACRHFGVGFIAYNPLAGGLLTGKHGDQNAAPRSGRFAATYYRDRFWKPEYFKAVCALNAACKRRGISLVDASLRWLAHHSLANGLLLGASTAGHFRQNLAACAKGRLSASLCAVIDGAWEIARPVCQRYFRDDSDRASNR